jgi:hypothetical protein
VHLSDKLLAFNDREPDIATHFGCHTLQRQSAGSPAWTTTDDHHMPLLQGA